MRPMCDDKRHAGQGFSQSPHVTMLTLTEVQLCRQDA